MKKIELHWAMKFRELVSNYRKEGEVIHEFMKFCNDEEKNINKKWDHGSKL